MRQIIGGNWKMNGNSEAGLRFINEMKKLGSKDVSDDIVIFPPFTIISVLAGVAIDADIALGGQDLYWEEKGAFTGEISTDMLKDAGAEWFLAGHSERRHVFGETDEIVSKKLSAGLKAGLKGILCVGELISEREAGLTEEVVKEQIIASLGDCEAATSDNFVIAYEPVWAIGTGLTATPEEAQRMHALIRGWVAELRGDEFTSGLRIQYGGSVKPENARDILSQPDINGALVGGASLNSGSFAAIIADVAESVNL